MRVRVPASLGRGGQAGFIEVDVASGATVRSVLAEIDRQLPGSLARMVNGDGRLHGYVNIYVNGVDIRHGDHTDTAVRESDEVLILPAISGG